MVPLEEVHKLLDQAISAWSNRQYEEISHGTTNGPPGRMLRIFLPIIDVLKVMFQFSHHFVCK